MTNWKIFSELEQNHRATKCQNLGIHIWICLFQSPFPHIIPNNDCRSLSKNEVLFLGHFNVKGSQKMGHSKKVQMSNLGKGDGPCEVTVLELYQYK